jgi:hypothetical protein
MSSQKMYLHFILTVEPLVLRHVFLFLYEGNQRVLRRILGNDVAQEGLNIYILCLLT